MQDFNLEIIPKMEELTTRLEDEIRPGFARVKDGIVAAGEFTGMPKLIETCKGLEDGASTMLKVIDETVAAFTAFIEKYKKIGEATGALQERRNKEWQLS